MEYILILGDTGFIAYKSCKYSILPSFLNTYFRRRPHSLSSDLRLEIISEVEKYPNLIRSIDKVKDTIIPSSFPFFFSDLALYSDGLACQDCSYIVRSEKTISKHYKDVHDWENPRGKGRIPKASLKNVPWLLNISCQQFFHLTPGRSYFKVDSRRPYPGWETRPNRSRSIEGGANKEESKNRSKGSKSLSI